MDLKFCFFFPFSLRMKGGPYKLRRRAKELSLILIVLVGATVLLWTWDRSPVLTSSLPSKNKLLHLSPDIKTVPLEPKRHVKEEISTLTRSEVINNKEEHHFDETSSTDTTETVPIQKKACNHAKGKWVIDDRRPLYSGFGCKQWLAPMWACRLMQRQDFAFEKTRWQPKDCDMEEFEGSKFLARMRDKTLAFVGDSLGRQQFQSLMCMITAGKNSSDVLDVGKEYGLVIPPGGKRPNGWAYRFPSTNTTVIYYWSSTLCDLEPLNVKDPHTEYAMHLDRPPAFLHQFLPKIDVVVLNSGHHWNRGKLMANRWVMYVGGVPNNNSKIADMGSAKNFTIHSTVKWVDSQLPKYPLLKAFYRSISPRHFVNGDWNTGGSCDNTTPMSIGKEVLQEESSDYSAASAVRGTGVKLLDITALSQVRDEGHISQFSITATPGVQDCLHWCLPGVPDTWNEILFAQI
ncbi:protein trichome birefringence-like 16 isoform X4 [Durio zibethinus]|uniref:Protein trichome birefringence-like 16 isoform X4 n=1 Tax=Durio zibethinus TaxID=66656 RepID=A0A6P5ZPG2_DURZI|nr:protein trichome birefringence-like 16 isoform X4 [Durio zibethinus]